MILFILIEFVVGLAVGWAWQTVHYHRLLNRSWLVLRVPTIANATSPTTIELNGGGE